MTETVPAFTQAQIRRIMFGLMLALFLASLDQTIVATALTAIATDLGGWENLSWVVSAYLIASTVTTPIYGRLSDLYGRRPVLLVSVTGFVVGALFCAAAQDMTQLILARVVQGLGGGGLRSISLAVVGDIFPPRDRGRVQGYLSSVFATASVAGPVLGGVFADYLSWHWIFLIDAPLGAAAFATTWFELRRLPRPGKRPKIDWLGALFILLSATPLLLGITAAQRSGSFLSLGAMICFALALIFLAALILQERAAVEPMLPPRLFGAREFVLGNAVTCIASMANIGLVIHIPLAFQLVAGLSTKAAGLRMIAITIGSVSGSFIGGQLVARLGRYRFIPVTGATVAAVMCFTIAGFGLGHSLAFDLGATLLLGLSFGAGYAPMTVAIQNALEPRDGGIGVACMMFFRLLGGAFGVATLSALLFDRLREAVPGSLAGHDLLQAASPSALESAFSAVFVAAGLAMLVNLGCALSLKDLPLRGR
jgi:EmrB/QacA subfamily drug resistance transporter